MTLVVLGLGSNLGDRMWHLSQAISLLKQHAVLGDITRSSIYENTAMLPDDAPEDWNIPFLNMVIKGETVHQPEQLFFCIKKIEQSLGRQETSRWAPREIDIDILCYDEQVIETDILQIPHQGLLERDFAIVPFAEVWPSWYYPHDGKTILELKNTLFPSHNMRLYEGEAASQKL